MNRDDDAPRRRSDERRRWSDDRIDDMRTDVEDLEDQVRALRLLPERVKGLRETVQALSDSIDRQAQRTTDLRADLRQVQRQVGSIDRKLQEHRERVEKRANGLDPDTDEPLPQGVPPFRPDVWFWLKLAGACATSVGVPIAVAVLAGGS
jgi:predicted RNase H-like nuclease (RuvC/YqgF family)